MDILTLEQLIEKCQQLKTTSEFERQTHHRIYTEFIKPFLHALSWEEGDLSLLPVGHYLQLTLKPDVLTLFILGGDFDRRYETTVRTARLETGISAVTNFDKLIVHFRDNSGVKEIENFSSAGYLSNLNTLQRLFSKESIESGDYLHYITDKLKSDFDAEFFDLLLSFRKEIAEGIWAEASNRAMLKEAYGDNLEIELNRLVQTILDRFLIYRFAEDKMLIPQSLSIKERQIQHESGFLPSIWRGIILDFDMFRGRYNGKIFDEGMADRITLQNNFLINFVKKLYDVGFSEHRIEVLGHIYEKYLGERVYIEGDKIRLDKTPEARKAGGVYYTPSYITKYIVDNTLGVMLGELEDKLEYIKELGDVDALTEILAQATDIKILDPACGSGAFLIQALKLLRDFYETYSEVAKEIRKKQPTDNLIDSGELTNKIDPIVYGNGMKSVRLSKAPGYYALQHNIYGVDIDERAVEVTAVSLMMQILDEVKDAPGLKFPAIMEENIKCGNSLISGVTDRSELEEDFKEEIGELIALRKQHKSETDSEKKIWISHTLFNKKRVVNLKLNSKLSEYFDDVNAKKPFNWEIEFPEVFFNDDGSLKENAGFDCVVGNPPYNVLSEKDYESEAERGAIRIELNYFNSIDRYASARGGQLNLFRLMLKHSFDIHKQKGRFGMIIPLSIVGDKSNVNLRKFLLKRVTLEHIEAFPQKDDENNRVFFEAKLSTCVIFWIKATGGEIIKIRVNTGKYIEFDKEIVKINIAELTQIDPDNLSIPILNQKNWNTFVKIHKNPNIIKLGEIATCKRGEVSLTFNKKCLTKNKSDSQLFKGVQIGRYRFYRKLSQGERHWIDENRLRKELGQSTRLKDAYTLRIVMQRITGIDEKVRLRCMICQPQSFVAESANYIITDINLYFLLALLNSHLMNGAFKLFSTNNNVNTYEIESLPVPRSDFTNPIEKSQHDELAVLADKMLHLNKRLHNKLGQLTFLHICDEINSNRLPLKGMGDRFRIAITGSKRKKLTPKVIEAFEVRDGELRLKNGKLTARIQGDETAISFLRTYLAHIDNETLDTLNAEYSKLDDKIRNLPVSNLTIEEMSQALSRWEGIEKEKESLAEVIQDTDNLIDAKVFRLYRLERDEIITVLDSLGTDKEIKADILDKWKREGQNS